MDEEKYVKTLIKKEEGFKSNIKIIMMCLLIGIVTYSITQTMLLPIYNSYKYPINILIFGTISIFFTVILFLIMIILIRKKKMI